MFLLSALFFPAPAKAQEGDASAQQVAPATSSPSPASTVINELILRMTGQAGSVAVTEFPSVRDLQSLLSEHGLNVTYDEKLTPSEAEKLYASDRKVMVIRNFHSWLRYDDQDHYGFQLPYRNGRMVVLTPTPFAYTGPRLKQVFVPIGVEFAVPHSKWVGIVSGIAFDKYEVIVGNFIRRLNDGKLVPPLDKAKPRAYDHIKVGDYYPSAAFPVTKMPAWVITLKDEDTAKGKLNLHPDVQPAPPKQ